MYVQADLNLSRVHLYEGRFSDIVAHMLLQLVKIASGTVLTYTKIASGTVLTYTHSLSKVGNFKGTHKVC